MQKLKPPGNPALVAARRARGWRSQQAVADAFADTARALGLRIDVSVRQVRRWESADPPIPSPDYQRVIEAMFGCPIDRLGWSASAPASTDIVRGATSAQDGWWRGVVDDVPDSLRRLVRLEDAATAVRWYEPLTIPGLLQTPAYALETVQVYDPAMPASSAYRRRELRIQRAKRWEDRPRPAAFIIGEQALCREIGGPAVMAEQLGHLLMLASERENLTVQVLPLDSLAALPAPCVLYSLTTAQQVVWLEHLTASVLVERPDDVTAYRDAYARLHAAALSPVASLEFIDERRRELCTAADIVKYRKQVGGSRATRTVTPASRSEGGPTST